MDGRAHRGTALRTRDVTASSILNETTLLVRATFAPWGGLLLLTALPYRFAQVWFVETLVATEGRARHYRDALMSVAAIVVAALAVAVIGRLVFARACRLQQNALIDIGTAPLRPRPISVAAALYTSAFFAMLSALLALPIVPLAITAIFSALSIATAELNEKASLTEPFRILARHARPARALAGIFFAMAVGFIVSWINLLVAFMLGAWALGGIAGVDAIRWSALLSPTTRLFTLIVTAGALVALEPFWIAAHVVYVSRVRSHRTGEDLKQWLDALKMTNGEEREAASL